VSDPGHQVGSAGTERRETDARDTGGRRGGLGHERRRGLVLCKNKFEAGLSESFDQIDDLSAGMPVHISHARRAQSVTDRVRNGQSHAHRMPP